MQTFLKAQGGTTRKLPPFFRRSTGFPTNSFGRQNLRIHEEKRAKESAQEVGTYQPLAWMFVGTRCFFFYWGMAERESEGGEINLGGLLVVCCR